MIKSRNSFVVMLGVLLAAGIGVVVLLGGKDDRSPGGAQRVSSKALEEQTSLRELTSLQNAKQDSHEIEEARQEGVYEEPTDTGVTTNEHDGGAVNMELLESIAAFQASPRYVEDYKTARTLLPLIKVGMTPQEVKAILGEPSQAHSSDESWYYGLFYSQYIVVRFGADGEVDKVFSTLFKDDEEHH